MSGREAKVPRAGVDLDLRLVRHFTVVAQELNFERAAAVLHMAQPALSRQMQRLERQLGVRLLDRTPQGSRLTAAGAVFLPHAHELVGAAQQAALRARTAGSPRAITIGYADDLVISSALRELRHRHPEVSVQTRHVAGSEARTVSSALAGGQLDALVTRAPLAFPADGLAVTVLYEEPRVLVAPADHPFAGQESVRPADLAQERLVPCRGAEPAWSEFWRLEPRPDGRPAPLGPVTVDTFEDKLEMIAAGAAVAILPASDPRPGRRDDLTVVPLDGVAPCQVVVVAREGDDSPWVADFRRIAFALLRPPADAGNSQRATNMDGEGAPTPDLARMGPGG